MPQLTLELETVTPLFMNGALGKPEVRVASFRGMFRYWLRAILGGQTNDLEQVRTSEEAIFGSTKRGSAVTVRAPGHDMAVSQRLAALPQRLTFD